MAAKRRDSCRETAAGWQRKGQSTAVCREANNQCNGVTRQQTDTGRQRTRWLPQRHTCRRTAEGSKPVLYCVCAMCACVPVLCVYAVLCCAVLYCYVLPVYTTSCTSCCVYLYPVCVCLCVSDACRGAGPRRSTCTESRPPERSRGRLQSSASPTHGGMQCAVSTMSCAAMHAPWGWAGRVRS